MTSSDLPVIRQVLPRGCRTESVWLQIAPHTITVAITDCAWNVYVMNVTSDWCPAMLFQQLQLREQSMAVIPSFGRADLGDELMPLDNMAYYAPGVVTLALPDLSEADVHHLQSSCGVLEWYKFAGPDWCLKSSDAISTFDFGWVQAAQMAFQRAKDGPWPRMVSS